MRRTHCCTAVIDAQLAAAESLCRRGESAAAVAICESLQTADSELVRAAAFRGLLAAKPAESLTLILAGLAAEEPWKRAVAADCLAQIQTARGTQHDRRCHSGPADAR